MTQMMQQAIELLTLPQIELIKYLAKEVEENPLLVWDQTRTTLPYFDTQPSETTSLTQHLMVQAEREFSGNDLEVARFLIGNIDDKGFYQETIGAKDQVILKVIQRFDPVGIGAKDSREAMLIQLEESGLKTHRAYTLLTKDYPRILKHRLSKSEQNALSEVKAHLDPLPGLKFSGETAPFHPPDLVLNEKGEWELPYEPNITLNETYLSHHSSKKALSPFITKGKWLLRALSRRRTTLIAIAEVIMRANREFFKGGELTPNPLKMVDVALELNLSPSTVSRAVKDKVLDTPLGLLPLKTFFDPSIKEQILLKGWIKSETTPLTDTELMNKFHNAGVKLSRRTVAKYRNKLKIPNSHHRKRS